MRSLAESWTASYAGAMRKRLFNNPALAGRIGLVLILLASLVLVFSPQHFLAMALQNSNAGLLIATVINAVIGIASWFAAGIGVALLTAYFVWRMNQNASSSVVIGRRDTDTNN